MSRLIDADALLTHEIEADRMGAMLVVGKGYILSAPTIEPPVVRCGNCKHRTGELADMSGYFICPNTGAYMDDDAFCSYGEMDGAK